MSGNDKNPAVGRMPKPPESDERAARIRSLETELAALRQAASNEQLNPAELGRAVDERFLETLLTVNVPEAFEAPFMEAQRYVARYFSDREENPAAATISIAGERYVLVRAASLSVEFVELVKSLYMEKGEEEALRVANNLLYDVAHAIGQADARSFRQKMQVDDPIEVLSAGPIHFAFAGWAFVDISPDSNPSPDENFLLLYEHPYSFESHSWIAKGKQSDRPVCIMNAGYSSGWCEESFGLPLVAVETECLAAGGESCRFVMAPPSQIEKHLEHSSVKHHGGRGADVSRVPEFFYRKRLEDELREANEQLEQRVQERTQELEKASAELRVLGSAVENASEGFVIMERRESDGEAVISFVNRGFTRITGLEPAGVIGRSPDDLPTVEEDRPMLVDIRDRVREGKSVDAELTAVRPDGSEYELEVHVMSADPEAESTNRWIAILHDISERKAHVEELQRQALHDDLTGLPNRTLLHDRIEHSIESLERSGKTFAVLLLDLDGFKEINDTFGHYMGDILLTKVAARLRDTLRSADTIARLGGDEFAILLDDLEEAGEVQELTRRLLGSLKDPFSVEEQNLVVNASIGIVLCPEHGQDPDTLMRRADVAMYAAKERHTGSIVYHTELDVHSPARIRLVSELRENVDDEHLVLHYQPQVDISTGGISRVEALLRWQHPDGRLMLPNSFLPLAETSDLIDRITYWVLERAIRDFREWLDSGQALEISVNLATRNLHDRNLPKRIERLLKKYEVPADMLTLEITESGLLRDSIMAGNIFTHLREVGVGLSIDDFGTGYSSLTHLKHLPFTELKIDRSFTRDVMENHADAAIVRTTIQLAHALGRKVVAEGVEEGATLDFLEECGCDYAQGFLFTRALEKSKLLDWLKTRDT